MANKSRLIRVEALRVATVLEESLQKLAFLSRSLDFLLSSIPYSHVDGTQHTKLNKYLLHYRIKCPVLRPMYWLTGMSSPNLSATKSHELLRCVPANSTCHAPNPFDLTLITHTCASCCYGSKRVRSCRCRSNGAWRNGMKNWYRSVPRLRGSPISPSTKLISRSLAKSAECCVNPPRTCVELLRSFCLDVLVSFIWVILVVVDTAHMDLLVVLGHIYYDATYTRNFSGQPKCWREFAKNPARADRARRTVTRLLRRTREELCIF